MRIISGSAGGTRLRVPTGHHVRPTPDLVRQAIFNSLGPRTHGARVLELFAGTGALALECLSRGAAHAVCVEKSEKHSRFILDNLERCGLSRDQIELRVQEASAALSQLAAAGDRFDLILADPPFGDKNLNQRSTSHAQHLLDNPHLPRLLARGGLFVLGHARRDTLALPEVWNERRTLRHGDSIVRFLASNPVRSAG